MYLTQITLPRSENLEGLSRNESKNPDQKILELIFKFLHTEQYLTNKDDYKYLLGFPEATNKNLGKKLHIFTQSGDDIHQHIKNGKLKRLLLDHCVLKGRYLGSNEIEKAEKYKVFTSKEKSKKLRP